MCNTYAFSGLRRRVHPQGNGLYGGRTASHAPEHHHVHVQGRSAGRQTAPETVATAVDERFPDESDLRRNRSGQL